MDVLPNVRGLPGYANVMDSAALLVRGFHLHYAIMTNLYDEGARWRPRSWQGVGDIGMLGAGMVCLGVISTCPPRGGSSAWPPWVNAGLIPGLVLGPVLVGAWRSRGVQGPRQWCQGVVAMPCRGGHVPARLNIATPLLVWGPSTLWSSCPAWT